MVKAAELQTGGTRVARRPDLGAMDFDLNRLLSEAAHDLAGRPSDGTTLEHVVELCVDSVPGCAWAGITLIEAGEIRTLAASHELIVTIDKLQDELGQGPCFEVLSRRETVVSNDVPHDPRWPEWGSRAAEAGVEVLRGLCLFADDDAAGALTLYARDGSFDQQAILEGQALAGHASVALATSLKERQLREALERRTVIGQATGILIERLSLSPDQAFALMQRISQRQNIKVHALARHLVETGVLLDSGPPDPG